MVPEALFPPRTFTAGLYHPVDIQKPLDANKRVWEHLGHTCWGRQSDLQWSLLALLDQKAPGVLSGKRCSNSLSCLERALNLIRGF